jgi:hypothetical protein
MGLPEFVSSVKQLLEAEYARLGFILVSIRTVTDPCDYETYMQGEIICPCGGMEHFTFRFSVARLDRNRVTGIAHLVLKNTASRAHLELDVLNGLLPASALDGSTYKGELMETYNAD